MRLILSVSTSRLAIPPRRPDRAQIVDFAPIFSAKLAQLMVADRRACSQGGYISLQQCRVTRNKRLRHPVLRGALGVKAMETVFIVAVALLVAMVGRAILDPPRAR